MRKTEFVATSNFPPPPSILPLAVSTKCVFFNYEANFWETIRFAAGIKKINTKLVSSFLLKLKFQTNLVKSTYSKCQSTVTCVIWMALGGNYLPVATSIEREGPASFRRDNGPSYNHLVPVRSNSRPYLIRPIEIQPCCVSAIRIKPENKGLGRNAEFQNGRITKNQNA